MKKFFKSVKDAFVGWFPQQPVLEKDVCEVKTLVKNSFKVIKTYQDANEDDEINLLEWISIAKAAKPLINDVRNWKAIKDRLLDFRYEDGKELLAFVIEEGILPEKAELVIEHLVAYIEIQISAYKEHGEVIINTFRK